MALIAPFRGLRYNPQVVPDLSLVVAPPYDVISPDAQRYLHARHPYNVVRLILGEQFETDDDVRNRYSRAGAYFRHWQAEKVLTREEAPAVYLYHQTFRSGDDAELTRRSVIALVRLEEFGASAIFPHERTMTSAKEDRLRVMLACHANLSPVFGVYPGPMAAMGPLAAVEQEAPAIDIQDWDGIRHRLWICQNRLAIESLRRAFEPIPLFIADGHHRYETALAFRDLMRAKDRGDPALMPRRPYNYIMMALVSAQDPGLVILPIHRLLTHLPGSSVDAYLARVARHFAVERVPVPSDPEGVAATLLGCLRATPTGTHRFGLYAGGMHGYVLTLADARDLESVAEGKPAVYRRLDVTILHAFLIEGPFRDHGLPTLPDDALCYTHDAREAVQRVQHGGRAAAFLLNPTRIDEVQAVACAGLRMPPKSTFFYPKLLTGLVIQPIHPDELVEP